MAATNDEDSVMSEADDGVNIESSAALDHQSQASASSTSSSASSSQQPAQCESSSPASTTNRAPTNDNTFSSGDATAHKDGPSALTEEAMQTPLHSCAYGNRLGYAAFSAQNMPDADQLNKHSDSCFFFTIDAALVYLSFYQDWGPLNVAMFYRFSLHLHGLLEDKALSSKKIILYSSDEHDKKANAALLMALYAMIVLRWSPAEALHPVSHLELRPFRDAGYARADFHMSLQDVVYGIKKGIDNRLLRLDEFDVREYEMYEKVENGDWNFITPHFLAFASPVEPGYSPQNTTNDVGSGSPIKNAPTNTKLPKAFRNVLDQFEKKNVKMVIRLNKKLYNAFHFTSRHMQHLEMFYEDGTNPTMDQCRQFIDVADHIIRNEGVVAVHCKAGLGRTGTLIGAYMIYKWGFTASESIAFQRFMRPGCVVGPQQHFLYQNQHTWVRWAAVDSVSSTTRSLPSILSSSPIARPDTPPSETEIAVQMEAVSKNTSQAAHTASSAASINGFHVPGQPRKTPGAKSRHAIALPETNDESVDPSEDLMLVKTSDDDTLSGSQAIESRPGLAAPDEAQMEIDVQATLEAQAAQHQADMEVEPARPRPVRNTSLQNKQAANQQEASRPVQKSKTGSNSKPLTERVNSTTNSTQSIPESAVVNTRTSPASPSAVPRTKASRPLGVVVDSKGKTPPTTTPNSPNSTGSDRYNLRTASRSISTGQLSSLTTAPSPPSDSQPVPLPLQPPQSTINNTSPSRLPTRISAKRRNTSKPAQIQQKDVFSSTAPPYNAHKISTRNLRKRRSSVE